MFTLKIKTENAAFDGPGEKSCEVARILRVIASDIENSENKGRAVDFNGNTVGEWSLK